ncbi:hypothetical protein BOX15_Mlig030838g1 [Macrostomum lignano]|uniref:RING-type domain-containing protein n=1 Tax=Macrostomum lignano TaxID=282301 RepID=A0A267EJT6_9PLAT|nr:hypothetical protein BOX15_Mlig030838g1 [Macrostomum lignano]
MASAKTDAEAGVKVANNAEFFVCNANIVGHRNRVWGHRNTVTGNSNQVYGNWNRVAGTRNTVRGINNRVVGVKNDVIDASTLGSAGSSAPSSSTSSAEESASNDGDSAAAAEVLVSVCKRVRVRTDANGRRQRENFHVELVERRLFGVDLSSSWTASSPLKGFNNPDTLYDLSGLDGADSDAAGLPCCVCLGRERCVKLSPCRHVPVCLACAKRLFNGARTRTVACPLCRSPVESVERLFLN